MVVSSSSLLIMIFAIYAYNETLGLGTNEESNITMLYDDKFPTDEDDGEDGEEEPDKSSKDATREEEKAMKEAEEDDDDKRDN